MKRTILPLAVLCGTLTASSVFSGCTKDYDDDLQTQREIIETNNKDLKDVIKEYQTLVDHKLAELDLAYKNADAVQQTQIDEAKDKLTQLRTDLNTASEQIANLRLDHNTLANLVETYKTAIEAEMQAIANRTTALENRADVVEADIEALKTFKADAETRIAALEASSTDYGTEIEALKTKVQEIDTKLASLETAQASLETAMTTADNALGKRIDDLNTSLTNQVTTLTGQITDQNTTLTGLITALSASVDTKETGLRNEIATALADAKQTAQNALDAYKDVVNTQLQGIANDIADVVADVTTLTNQYQTLTNDVTALTANYNNLLTTVTGFDGKITDVTTALNNYKVDMAAQLATINSNIDNKADKAELASEVAAINTTITNKETELKAYTDNAITELVTNGKVKDNTNAITALNIWMDAMKNTTLPEINNKISSLETSVKALQNRLQLVKWIPAYDDNCLTLAVTDGSTAFTAATLQETIIVTSNDPDLSTKMTNGTITVTPIFNTVSSRAIVETDLFGTPSIAAGSTAGTFVISFDMSSKLADLYTAFGTLADKESTGYQLAVKLTDANGNSVQTEFATIRLKK